MVSYQTAFVCTAKQGPESKLYGPCIAGAEIAKLDIVRPDNAAPDSRGGQRETGQCKTK